MARLFRGSSLTFSKLPHRLVDRVGDAGAAGFTVGLRAIQVIVGWRVGHVSPAGDRGRAELIDDRFEEIGRWLEPVLKLCGIVDVVGRSVGLWRIVVGHVPLTAAVSVR